VAHLTFTELLENSVAAAADVNSTLTSWNTQSTDIDASNVRDEGLDGRSVASRAITPSDGFAQFSDAGSVTLTNTSPALVAIGATNVICGPFNINESDKEQLVVRCSCKVRINATGSGAANKSVTVYMAYTDDASPTSGSTWNVIARSDRDFLLNNYSAGVDPPKRGVYTVSFLFSGGGSLSTANLHFGLFSSISGSGVNYYIADVHIHGVTYAR
jgi:hypothetical protein